MTAEERRLYLREWRAKNPDKVRVYNRKYKENHKDEIRAYNNDYRWGHKEEINTYQRQYRKTHKKEFSEYQERYREKHKREIHERLCTKTPQKSVNVAYSRVESIKLYNEDYFSAPESWNTSISISITEVE